LRFAKESLPHTLVKFDWFALHAVAVLLAREAGCRRKVQQNGEIGNKAINRKGVEVKYNVAAQSAGNPLIGDTGVNKPIAENHIAERKVGANHLLHILRAPR